MTIKNSKWALLVVLVATLTTGCGGPGERKAAYFAKGMELFEKGDYAKARVEFSNVLQIDPKYAPAWYMRGQILEKNGKAKAAYGAYAQTVELDPSNIDARIKKAEILTASNEYDLARQELDAADKVAEESADILMVRGAIARRTGDVAAAEEYLAGALALEPHHVDASANLARLLHQQKRSDEAEQILKDAIVAHPNEADLRLQLGWLYDRTGNTAGAVEILQALATASPEESEYRERLVRYLVEVKRIDQAEALMRQAVEAEPEALARKVELLRFLADAREVDTALAEVRAMLKQQPNEPALQLIETGLLRRSGDVESAEAGYRRMIETRHGESPHALQARTALAHMYVDLGRIDEAKTLLAEVLEQSPKEADALELRARLAMQDNDIPRAISDLRTLLREYPDRVSAQRLLGEAHAIGGDFALAQDALGRAINLAPKQPLAYLQLAELKVRNGNPDGALVILQQLLEKVPENVAAQQAIAQIQFSKRDWTALGKTAQRIKRERPTHPLGFYLEGLALSRQGQFEEAKVVLEKALATAPQAEEVLVALARTLVALDRIDEAERRVKVLLEANPNSLMAGNLLGDIYLMTEQFGKAVEQYREVIRFHPKSPKAYAQLASVLQVLNKPDEAEAALEAGIAETGRNDYLVFSLAEFLQRNGKRDEAIAAYERILKRLPDFDVAVNNLAVLLADKENDSVALDRALDLAGKFKSSEVAEYLDTLGWVHYQRGEYNAAIVALEKAVEKKSGLAEAAYHLGLAYLKTGSKDQARQSLERALNTEQDYPGKQNAETVLASLVTES